MSSNVPVCNITVNAESYYDPNQPSFVISDIFNNNTELKNSIIPSFIGLIIWLIIYKFTQSTFVLILFGSTLIGFITIIYLYIKNSKIPKRPCRIMFSDKILY
jgi:hypothetical protein